MTNFNYRKSSNYISFNDNDRIILIINEWFAYKDWTVAPLNRFLLSRTLQVDIDYCMFIVNVRMSDATFYREWCREECYAANNGCIKICDMRDHLSSALSQRGCRNYQTKVPATTIPVLRRPVSDFLLFHDGVSPWHRMTLTIPISSDRPRICYRLIFLALSIRAYVESVW